VRAYAVEAACLAGWGNVDELKRWTEAAAAEWMTLDPWAACPWHGGVQLAILWSAREYADVMPAVERLLSFILEQVSNGRGWTTYLDPWGFPNSAGFVDYSLARQIVVERVPMILRGWQPDGSFGGLNHLGWGAGSRTFTVHRALVKWGLLDELRRLPPLPPDWKTGRSVPPPRATSLRWRGTESGSGSTIGPPATPWRYPQAMAASTIACRFPRRPVALAGTTAPSRPAAAVPWWCS